MCVSLTRSYCWGWIFCWDEVLMWDCLLDWWQYLIGKEKQGNKANKNIWFYCCLAVSTVGCLQIRTILLLNIKNWLMLKHNDVLWIIWIFVLWYVSETLSWVECYIWVNCWKKKNTYWIWAMFLSVLYLKHFWANCSHHIYDYWMSKQQFCGIKLAQ